MSKQRVVMVKHRPFTESFNRPLNEFKLNPPKDYKKKRRAKSDWRHLQRVGASLTEQYVRFRPTTQLIDEPGRKLLDLIRLSAEDLYRIYRQEADAILCGHDIAHQLFNEEIEISCKFGFQIEIAPPDGSGRYDNPYMRRQSRVCGLKIVILPWMEGWCLLPKEVSQNLPFIVQ